MSLKLDYLRELSGGDAEFEKEMLNEYLKHTPEYLSKLLEAQEKGDLDQIKFMAHKWLSSVRMLGDEHFVETLKNLEIQSGEGAGMDVLVRLIEDAKKAQATMVEAIQKEL